jgi:hypothetical protein
MTVFPHTIIGIVQIDYHLINTVTGTIDTESQVAIFIERGDILWAWLRGQPVSSKISKIPEIEANITSIDPIHWLAKHGHTREEKALATIFNRIHLRTISFGWDPPFEGIDPDSVSVIFRSRKE